MSTWAQRQSKLDWYRRNREKVLEINRRWRAGREHILRRQARERMRRFRARRYRALSLNVTTVPR